MVTTLRMHVRNRESRRFFGTYLAGKMLGLGLVLLAVWGVTWYFSTKAGAGMLGQETPVKQESLINAVNTTWVLVAASFGRTILPTGRIRKAANVPGRAPLVPIEFEYGEPGVHMGQ